MKNELKEEEETAEGEGERRNGTTQRKTERKKEKGGINCRTNP